MTRWNPLPAIAWLIKELLANVAVAACLAYLAFRYIPHPVWAALTAAGILAAPVAIWGRRFSPRLRAWSRRWARQRRSR